MSLHFYYLLFSFTQAILSSNNSSIPEKIPESTAFLHSTHSTFSEPYFCLLIMCSLFFGSLQFPLNSYVILDLRVSFVLSLKGPLAFLRRLQKESPSTSILFKKNNLCLTIYALFFLTLTTLLSLISVFQTLNEPQILQKYVTTTSLGKIQAI